MRYMKKAAVLIVILINTLNYNCFSASSEFTQEPYKILFIGSSYFNGYDMPGLFEDLANNSGKTVYIDRQITNGLYLEDHANSISTEAKINEKDWDYVILQGVGALVAYPDYYTHHPVYPALVALQNKISENCDSTKMVFCLPWAFEDGMTWVQGWTDTYEDMQIKIYENTLRYLDDLDFVIAPVGWAWNTVLKEKNYPLHYLHLSDWNHPSLQGSYLTACVIYSTIYQESSVEIQYYGGLPEENANYFQTVASNTVLDSLDLWNITVKNPLITEFPIPNEFNLYQNYPNPFRTSTQINYEIQKRALVEIALYDIFGKRYANLVNENKLPGSYSVSFNASNLKSGIYSYRIKIGNQYQEKKILLMK